MGVGALVKHQKTGIDTLRYRALRGVECDVDGMRMATKIRPGLKQGKLGATSQAVRCCQTCNAGTYNCNFHN